MALRIEKPWGALGHPWLLIPYGWNLWVTPIKIKVIEIIYSLHGSPFDRLIKT
jgi:hypothetical protein